MSNPFGQVGGAELQEHAPEIVFLSKRLKHRAALGDHGREVMIPRETVGEVHPEPVANASLPPGKFHENAAERDHAEFE
jgi:hypothetical protein